MKYFILARHQHHQHNHNQHSATLYFVILRPFVYTRGGGGMAGAKVVVELNIPQTKWLMKNKREKDVLFSSGLIKNKLFNFSKNIF